MQQNEKYSLLLNIKAYERLNADKINEILNGVVQADVINTIREALLKRD